MQSEDNIKFSGPAYYKISIQGRLSTELESFFNEMKISAARKSDGTTITTLEGRITDQAELSGIINMLYEWQFPLLRVECEGDLKSDS